MFTHGMSSNIGSYYDCTSGMSSNIELTMHDCMKQTYGSACKLMGVLHQVYFTSCPMQGSVIGYTCNRVHRTIRLPRHIYVHRQSKMSCFHSCYYCCRHSHCGCGRSEHCGASRADYFDMSWHVSKLNMRVGRSKGETSM